MSKRMRTSVVGTLDAATLFLEVIERDFQKNKLHHLGQAKDLDNCFKNLLNLSIDVSDSGGNFSQRVSNLQGSLLAISSAVKEKVDQHILFSDRAAEEITCLFTSSLEFLKTSMDFLRTDNSILLRWLENKQAECRNYCDTCMTSHEERLIEGVCVPAASLVYLDMLRGFNEIHWQIVSIIRLLDGLYKDSGVIYGVN